MNTFKIKTRSQHMRDIEQATGALMQGEKLAEALREAAQQYPTNCFIAEALDKATQLVYELEADMIHHMERALEAGIDPEEMS
jgi:thiamine monophosphate synthase